jgi:hypothetical protein
MATKQIHSWKQVCMIVMEVIWKKVRQGFPAMLPVNRVGDIHRTSGQRYSRVGFIKGKKTECNYSGMNASVGFFQVEEVFFPS